MNNPNIHLYTIVKGDKEIEVEVEDLDDIAYECGQYLVENPLDTADYTIDVYEAYMQASGASFPTDEKDVKELIEKANEAYQGTFDNSEDFARDLLQGLTDTNEWHMAYIDYERMGRDLMMDYTEADNHYFRD